MHVQTWTFRARYTTAWERNWYLIKYGSFLGRLLFTNAGSMPYNKSSKPVIAASKMVIISPRIKLGLQVLIVLPSHDGVHPLWNTQNWEPLLQVTKSHVWILPRDRSRDGNKSVQKLKQTIKKLISSRFFDAAAYRVAPVLLGQH